MLDYLITNFYPEIEAAFQTPTEKYTAMYEEVCQRTAKLVAKWQLFGFCHGVLNTDNMSILGLTIDYGPFGFLEHFDPNHICNHSDKDRGRYRYKSQPDICMWNLTKLAEALSPLIDLEQAKSAAKAIFWDVYNNEYQSLLNRKLGLVDVGVEQASKQTAETESLKRQFWALMEKFGCDFTNTFRVLSKVSKSVEMTP